MSLYVSEKVGNEIVLKKYAPAVPVYRGFWAVTIGGFAGTLVECNGSMRYIGSNEKTIYQIVEPGTYTFTATRHGETKSKTIVLDDKDPNNSYTVNLGLYIGMQYLEYIEADSTQWIDTGIVPHDGYSCELTFQFTSVIPSEGEQMDAQICGVRQSEIPDRFYPIAVNSSGYLRCAYGNTQVVYDSMTSAQVLEKHTINLNKNGHIYLDDVDYGSCSGTYVEPQNPQYTMYLFKWNYGPTPYSNPICKMKIYEYKLWDNNGTLVSDFVPIKDDTNHGAMYDKVTQQIFYNSGEGEFICGPNKPYTRIQYLEGICNEQYIDLGIVPTVDMTYYGKFGFQSVISGSYEFFGARDTMGSGLLTYTTTSDNNMGIDFFRTSSERYIINNVNPVANDIFVFDIQNKTMKISKNGSVIDTHTFTDDGTTTETLYLNGTHSTNAPTSGKGVGRIYAFKIWDNGTLIHDMIPILDNEGTPCMYDQVNDRLYYNNGTGEFIPGPEKKVPDDYVELEYLQSTGTQYINTGIHNVDCDTYQVKTKYNYTSISNNSLCGNYASSGYASFGQIFVDTSNNSSVYSGIGNVQRVTFGNMTINTDYTDEFTIDCTLGTITRTLNGTTRSGNELNFSSRQDQPCFLYCCNMGTGVPEQFGSEKIYYFQIYKDDVLVLDLIPAKRISDNVVGMYDLVSQQFFTNAGTGQFIAGPVKQ